MQCLYGVNMDKREQFGVNAVRQDIAAIRQKLAAISGLSYGTDVEPKPSLHRIIAKLDGFRWFVAGLMVVWLMVSTLEAHFIR